MGLNEKNEAIIRQEAEKSSGKLVKLYCQAIKTQHRKALRATEKKQEKLRETFDINQTNLLAS